MFCSKSKPSLNRRLEYTEMSTLDNSPDDILHEIAYYLYPVELFAFREVCKRFSSMGTEHFWKQKIQLDFDVISESENQDTESRVTETPAEKKNWKTYLQAYRKALEKSGLVMGNPQPDQTSVKFIDPTTFIPYRYNEYNSYGWSHYGRQKSITIKLVGVTVTQRDFNLRGNGSHQRNIKWSVVHDGIDSTRTNYVMFSNMYNTFQEAVETLDKNMRPVTSHGWDLSPSAKMLQIAFRKVGDRAPGDYMSISSRSTKYAVPGLDEI